MSHRPRTENDDLVTCPDCNGDGLDRVAASQGACHRCGGSGQVLRMFTTRYESVPLIAHLRGLEAACDVAKKRLGTRREITVREIVAAYLEHAVPDQPPDPRRPENRDGQTVTVVDEAHEHENWCRIHNRRMAGVRSTGNWACEAYYEQHEIRDGDCVLALRPRNENYAEPPDQEKQ